MSKYIFVLSLNKVDMIFSLGYGSNKPDIDIEWYAKCHRGGGADNENETDSKSLKNRLFGKESYTTNLPWRNIISQQQDYNGSFNICFHYTPYNDRYKKTDSLPTDDPPILSDNIGTGSDYFCNETFYRIAKIRQSKGLGTVLTGFAHVHKALNSSKNVVISDIQKIIFHIKDIIKLSFITILFVILNLIGYAQPVPGLNLGYSPFTEDSLFITPENKNYRINVKNCIPKFIEKEKDINNCFYSVRDSRIINYFENMRKEKKKKLSITRRNISIGKNGYLDNGNRTSTTHHLSHHTRNPRKLELVKISSHDTMHIKIIDNITSQTKRIYIDSIFFKKGHYELNILREIIKRQDNNNDVIIVQSFNYKLTPIEDWLYLSVTDTNSKYIYIAKVTLNNNTVPSLTDFNICINKNYIYKCDYNNAINKNNLPNYLVKNINTEGNIDIKIKNITDTSKVMKIELIRDDNYYKRRPYGMDLKLDISFREGIYKINIDSNLAQKYEEVYTDIKKNECYYSCCRNCKKNKYFYWDITPNEWIRNDE